MEFSIEKTHVLAAELRSGFVSHIKDVSYEDKGILFSEMLFLYAGSINHNPVQILESGRARAQSTLILSLCFPDSEIISIERYRSTEDADIAATRLSGRCNVAPLFGDSEKILPQLVLPGDIVLIDGPKRFRALCLAFDVLATGKPRAVYVHDCHKGLPERELLEECVPQAFFSDDPDFVESFRDLDERCWDTIEERGKSGWRPYAHFGATKESYGPTLACIPYDPAANYLALKRKFRRVKILRQIFRRKP